MIRSKLLATAIGVVALAGACTSGPAPTPTAAITPSPIPSPTAAAITASPVPSPTAAAICVGRDARLGWSELPVAAQRLGDAWMAQDAATRRQALEDIWAEDGIYVNAFDEQPAVGRQAVADYMAFGYSTENYLEIVDWSEGSVVGNRMLIRWRDCCPDGTLLLTGAEVAELDEDGRFSRVTSFWDSYVAEVAAEACG